MKTKKDKEYSFNHTKERLKQRYNLDISKEEYEQLCSKKYSNLISIEKQKDDVQMIYNTSFKLVNIRIVWSQKKNCITTVLKIGEEND